MSRANPRFHRANTPLPAPVGDAFQCSWIGNVDNQLFVITFDVMNTAFTQPPSTEEANIGLGVATALAPNFKPCLSNEANLTGLKVSCLTTPSRNPAITSSANATGVGSGSANHLNTELAVIINKQTNFKGQHGRGRLYMPSVPVAFVAPGTDANRLTLVALANYGLFATSLQNLSVVVGGNTYHTAIHSRQPGGQAIQHAAFVISCTTRILLGTVRRRRIGRGK